MRETCARVKVFHVHNLATNEKCINNLSIDFSPGSLIETPLNLSQVYRKLELFIQAQAHFGRKLLAGRCNSEVYK